MTFNESRWSLQVGVWASAMLIATHAMGAETPKAKPPTVSELVVTAEPKAEIGAAVGDIKPDLQLAPEDVQTYGVSTITELLAELAPEIGSNSGRGSESPAILLNGRRISGLNEIRNLPTESILRVDILPEEAALKYGFSANQRVVNIVLRDHYGSALANLQGGASTAGGAASGQAEVGETRIAGERRFNIDLKYNPKASLTEAARNVTPLTTDPVLDLAGNPVDDRHFRTLVSQTQMVSANAVFTRPIFADIKATVNGTFEATTSDTLRGLPTVSLLAPSPSGLSQIARLAPALGALNQKADVWNGHLGVSFNRDIQSWRLALTGNYDHADNRNSNDLGVDATALQAAIIAGTATVTQTGPVPSNLLTLRTPDTSRSQSDTANLQFIASGPILTLPAGQVRTSFRVGVTDNAFSSDSERAGFEQLTRFSRSTVNAQASIDVPLTSKKAKILPLLGDINLNTHVAIDQLSDFGTLTTFGYGLHWVPIAGLSILASHLRDQAAPTQQQLGAPLLLTPGVRIFDYATNRTVDVTQISGGVRTLNSDGRDRMSIRMNYQPFADQQLIFRVDYNQAHYKNPISTFPSASAAIQAAFPDRFIRNAQGDLTEVDYRPVNFVSQAATSLKWGFDYSRPIGPVSAPPPRNQALAELRRAAPGAAAALVGRRAGGSPGATAEGLPAPVSGGPGPGPYATSPQATQGPEATADGPQLGAFGAGAGFSARGSGGGGPAGGGYGRGAVRGGAGGRGSAQDGRLRISVFETIYFVDNFLVRPGGPVLDFLSGSALGGLGGQPRQEIHAQINIAERGFGGELNMDWKSGTTVKRGTLGAGTGDLDFSSLAKVNARLFADLTRRKTLIEREPWLKGSRITFSVSNIFDQRLSVHDARGATPLSFQPAYIDALGRTWRIEFRKLFS